MSSARLSEARSEQLETNLKTLGADQPELAERLRRTPVPAGVEGAIARDGTETFRVRLEDGTWTWFGRSSMPTISAPALVDDVRAGGQNLFVPGIGTGYEPLLALQRLPSFCAAFVYEPAALNLKLALSLHDYVESLRQRRLVLLCGDSLAQALDDYLQRHPGFEFPRQLLNMVGIPPGQRDRLRLNLEAAGTRLAHWQWQRTRQAASEITVPGTSAAKPRLLVLSPDPRTETSAWADRLVHAAARLGWPAAACVPNRPDRSHLLARIEAARDHRPHLVILLNCVARALADCLPRDLPVCSWFTSPEAAGPAFAEGPPDDAFLFAAEPRIVNELQAAGANSRQIGLLEPAAVQYEAEKTEGSVAFPTDSQGYTAIFANAVDAGPAAAGITLTSQARLWEALVDRLRRRPGAWRGQALDRLMAEAEAQVGVKLTDRDQRRRLIELARDRQLPTLLARETIQQLNRLGVAVAVWGTGWDDDPAIRPLVRGGMPGPAARSAICRSAGVVAFLELDRVSLPTLLDCLAAGGCPVLRSDQPVPAELHPQLAEVLNAVPQERSVEGLARLVRELLTSADARADATSRGRKLVLEHHLLEHRLLSLRNQVLEG